MKKQITLIATLILMGIYPFQVYGMSNISPPNILSEAAIVIDAKSGDVIYEKNKSVKMYPASLTKIATAIYAIENGNLDDVVTVSENARNTEGTSVYLEEGEKVTLKKLLQGLLINSGNDAGVAIAEHLSGSVKDFSDDINEYLQKEVGVHNTNFKNPHGLFEPSHVTTAEGLAKITQYAFKNKLFREIFATEKLEWEGESWDTTLITHHKLMREIPYEGITGGKTGYTGQSGYTLATTAERENTSLIVITLKNNLDIEAYTDTIELLDYGFEHFQTSFVSAGKTFRVEGEEYLLPKNLFYTHEVEEKVIEEVGEDGTLQLVNQEDGDVIKSITLQKISKQRNIEEVTLMKKQVDKSKEKRMTLFESYFTEMISLFILLVLVASGGIYYFLKNKKMF
ncbi:D-alanyl-D-alanine carboxypeptidase family protein [Ornithinibacillus salinisoli]|uniref:D-alanyl-D-alanine carboxypeptidase family protein n=1 Tax=Ornithinibacillus salinisoli TaxID=1848459 RepID=A0ABW4VUF5_9BACI